MSAIDYLQGFASDQHMYRHSRGITAMHGEKGFWDLCGKTSRSDAYWVIAMDGRKVIGTLTINFGGTDDKELFNLLVAENYRDKDVLQNLLSRAKKFARHQALVATLSAEDQYLVQGCKSAGAQEHGTQLPGKICLRFPFSRRISGFY